MRGLFTAASGMLSSQLNLDRVANDLANVNTVGYRGEIFTHRSYPGATIHRFEGTSPFRLAATGRFSRGTVAAIRPVVGRIGQGTAIDGVYLNTEHGLLRETGNPLDVALEDDSFLQVVTPQGVLLTRAGNLTLDANGFLVTADGEPVLGEAGPLRVPPPGAGGAGAARVEIDADGRLLVDGVVQGRLARVTVPRPELLEPAGANHFRVTGGSGAATPVPAGSGGVRSGWLEFANVSPITAMVEMIAATRTYEAAAKVVQAYDEQYGRLINAVLA